MAVAKADRAALLLRRTMTEAFLETLPGALTRGLVEPTIGQDWARPPPGAADRAPIWENTGRQKRRAARGME